MIQFRGEHALVTGANRGIGAAVARKLATAGADVTMMVRTKASATTLADELGALGVRVNIVEADITDGDAVRAACAAAVEGLGPVTILINNAGTATSAPFLKSGPHLFEEMLVMHLRAPVLISQAVLPAMLARGAGRIVNVASIAGLQGGPYISAYASAKHAMVGLTRALAAEYRDKGVTVNAVCPGYVDTQLVSGAMERITTKTGLSSQKALAAMLRDAGQTRLVTTDEVAEAVLAYCDPASRTTGEARALMGAP